MSHDRLPPSAQVVAERVSKQIIAAASEGGAGVAQLGRIKDTAVALERIGELDSRVARGLVVQANQGLSAIVERNQDPNA